MYIKFNAFKGVAEKYFIGVGFGVKLHIYRCIIKYWEYKLRYYQYVISVKELFNYSTQYFN